MHKTVPRFQERWGVSIIVLHWVSAACIVVLLKTGWQLSSHAAHIVQRMALLEWHASVGVILLLATIVRLFARLVVKSPVTSAESRFQRLCAGAIQLTLYVIMLALAVTGIIAASPRPFASAVQLFGIRPLPRITGIPSVLMRSMPSIHATLVWTFLGLVGLHFLAAIYGTLIRKDGTIFRILPLLDQDRHLVWKRRSANTYLKPSSGDLPKVIVRRGVVATAILVVFLVLALS